jgi:hypothetical protein
MSILHEFEMTDLLMNSAIRLRSHRLHIRSNLKFADTIGTALAPQGLRSYAKSSSEKNSSRTALETLKLLLITLRLGVKV